MKKTILATFAVVAMLVSVSTAAFANLYSIKAENGKILNPTGISVDAGGMLSLDKEQKLDDYRVELGYGAFPAITLSGSYEKDGDFERLLAKAYLSPAHNGEGYTLYAGYDLNNGQFAMVGASLWINYKYLFSFINMESDVDRRDRRSTQVTPGFNLRLTRQIRILGEADLNTENWRAEALRAGVSYHLANRVAAKFIVEDKNGFDSDAVFYTGLSMEI